MEVGAGAATATFLRAIPRAPEGRLRAASRRAQGRAAMARTPKLQHYCYQFLGPARRREHPGTVTWVPGALA